MAESSKSDGLPAALAAAIALVVAGLAAVGITGDFVPRLVRDQPTQMSSYLIVALVGAGVIAVAALLNKRFPKMAPWVGLGGVIAVLVATSLALSLGAQSVADREQPRVVLSAAASQNIVVITVDASGAGLRPRDDMLVQVIGLRTAPDKLDENVALCEGSQLASEVPSSKGALLAWQRLGPDTKGNVSGTMKAEVAPDKFQMICAWAVLSDKDVESPSRKDNRTSAAYLRLNTATSR